MGWGPVGRGSLESRRRRRRPRYWFGCSVALDRLGRVGHAHHEGPSWWNAGRRSYLHDRAARRSDLNHLAGLDAGRERDADLHFLIARAGRRRKGGQEKVVRASRAGGPPPRLVPHRGGREEVVLAPRSGPKVYCSLRAKTGLAWARSRVAQRPRVAGFWCPRSRAEKLVSLLRWCDFARASSVQASPAA